MGTKIKRGRPSDGGGAAKVTTLHVVLDEDTLAALERLEARVDGVGHGKRSGRRSIAVRRALREAADRLRR